MNNQSLILLAIGALMAAIVAGIAIDQFHLDKYPPSEVDGLIWQVTTAFDRIRDLEATLRMTNEAQPAENVRMKVRYVQGPPPVFSMRYVAPPDLSEDSFIASVRDETFTVEGDQLFHYLSSADIIVSRRWPGVPLAMIGLGVLDISQLKADWGAGKTEIKILQNISGFTGIPFASSISMSESFSQIPAIPSDRFTVLALSSSQSYSLCFSLCLEVMPPLSLGLAKSIDVDGRNSTQGVFVLEVRDLDAENSQSMDWIVSFSRNPEFQVGWPQLSLGLAEVLDADSGNSIPRSYILEVRNSETKDLQRMVWIDRETYFIQKVVTFKNGQRSATLLVELLTINQGLMQADVITPPPAGVENIRG